MKFTPGTIVYHEINSGEREYGIVVHSWEDSDGWFDHYVAFFGAKMPDGEPSERPYILRYSGASLVRVEQCEND